MIGYYVHHHGNGHLQRMLALRARLRSPMTVLSSLAPPTGFVGPWLELPGDDEDSAARGVTANGTLHWAPRHGAGLARRTAMVTGWLAATRPSLVVVDVSVEVAVLVRLAGVPVVVVGMPGDRMDAPHRLAYDLADNLLAPWPARTACTWPPRWQEKAWHVGAFSRFDDRPRAARPPFSGRGLLLWGNGGSTPSESALADLRRATPGWTWDLACPSHRKDDDELWTALSTCDVVVTHGGQNAVAEVAAARAPAVVVAAPRPFDEQVHTVRSLAATDLAETVEAWPAPDRWPVLLDRARSRGGDRWRRWSPGDGALRAARLLDGATTPSPAARAVGGSVVG